MLKTIKAQALNAVMAFAGFMICVTIITAVYETYQKLLPVSYWMSVDSLLIEDSKYPSVRITRTVSEDLIGAWSVEVHRLSNNLEQVCQGSGISTYLVKETRQLNFSLGEFVGNQGCYLTPGRYVLIAGWKFTNSWGVNKTLSVQSNSFTVLPE